MIRHRSIVSATVAVCMALTLPGLANAKTIGTAQARYHAQSVAGSTAIRTGSTQDAQPYRVQYRTSIHSWVNRLFAKYAAALAFAKKQHEAAIYATDTGTMLYTNRPNYYIVMIPQKAADANASVNGKTFASLPSAVNAGSSYADVTVVNGLTGSAVWSNADNYLVRIGTTDTLYQNYADALTAATSSTNGQIFRAATDTPLWTAAFTLSQNGTFVRSFATLLDAQSYAGQTPNSVVTSVVTGKDVWDDIPRFDVYENGQLVKQFAYQSDAVTYAHHLSNATVVELDTGQTVYSTIPLYYVDDGGIPAASFSDEPSAIAYAKQRNGAVVVKIADNQIVWSAAGPYGVYRYMQLLKSFSTLSSATAYAKLLDHTQVIQSSDWSVVYTNYPTTVTSYSGDTVSVQNGEAVDTWGNADIILAPAPVFMQPGQTYVSHDYLHWYATSNSGDIYVGMWENPYQTMNLETSSTLTATQINDFLATHARADSVLQHTGDLFIEAEKTFGVNAQYLVAHAIIESAWGTSYFARNRDNLFGYEAYTTNPDAAATFRSIEYDINFEGWFVRNEYLSASGQWFNGPNLDGMNVDYATGAVWATSIARVMSEIATYTPAIGSQPLMTESFQRKVFSYPAGATGKTTVTTAVYTGPQDATNPDPTVIATIPQGTIVPTLGDTPGWDQVSVSNQKGFVDWNNIYLMNIDFVVGIDAGSELNIRSGPSSSDSVVAQAGEGSYLVVLQAAKGGWVYVETADGTRGYASAQFLRATH